MLVGVLGFIGLIMFMGCLGFMMFRGSFSVHRAYRVMFRMKKGF